MAIGEKIKKLRRKRNLSQDTLAQNLGVSFQAVSRWENGQTAPDISLIPAIAYFFRVSIDELFDYSSYEQEEKIGEICDEAVKYRETDPARAKEILNRGLQRYPGNELLMNHLLYPLQALQDHDEIVRICKSLISVTTDNEIKYDACRILADTYHAMGEELLVREQLDQIPELYFTKLELKALFFTGEERREAALDQKEQSIEMAVEMAEILAEDYVQNQKYEKAEEERRQISLLRELL